MSSPLQEAGLSRRSQELQSTHTALWLARRDRLPCSLSSFVATRFSKGLTSSQHQTSLIYLGHSQCQCQERICWQLSRYADEQSLSIQNVDIMAFQCALSSKFLARALSQVLQNQSECLLWVPRFQPLALARMVTERVQRDLRCLKTHHHNSLRDKMSTALMMIAWSVLCVVALSVTFCPFCKVHGQCAFQTQTLTLTPNQHQYG